MPQGPNIQSGAIGGMPTMEKSYLGETLMKKVRHEDSQAMPPQTMEPLGNVAGNNRGTPEMAKQVKQPLKASKTKENPENFGAWMIAQRKICCNQSGIP
ncbi:hypothetical protein VNO78_01218 [Psophocarpus tetragonolobus]|uniref:Uncharacterized protein n=1 Tax=Psophocarpus tetragonolobus TaxID=3891 RepID=A0AAN9T1D7_PSOTE